MKQIILLFSILVTNILFSQRTVDYSSRLSHFKGIAIIDGSEIDPEMRFANVETGIMFFADKSAITFANCIVKVDGPVDASSNCKIRLVNAYIICKKYTGPKTDRIITTNNIEGSQVSDITYLNKLKGNPTIEIIDKSGKVIAKGSKKSLSEQTIETGIYDVRSAGNFYDSNVLLAGD